jgi:hypothetical protein
LAPVAVLDDDVAGKLSVEGAVERVNQWIAEPEQVPS